MKLVVVLCAGGREEQVRQILEKVGVEGFTEVEGAKGTGKTGPKLGTRLFPGTSTMVWSVVPDQKVDMLMGELEKLAGQCYPAEGLRAFVLPVERSL